MNDMDPVFTTALQERAEGDVRVEDLLDGARRRGIRHRRNRRLATGAGAGLAVAAVLAAATLLPRAATTPSPTGSAPPPTGVASSAAGPAAAEKPRPPAVPGLAPLTAGGTVGEGRQIHLDTVDPAPFGLEWTSGDGVESIRAGWSATSEFGYSRYTVVVAPTAERLDQATAHLGEQLTGPAQAQPLLTGGGAPGTLRWTQGWASLRWQPRPNVWAFGWVKFHDSVPDPLPVIGAADARGAMLEVSGGIRYDRVLRCAATFRLTWAPPGTATAGCSLLWDWTDGLASMAFTVPGGGAFHVSPTDAADVHTNGTYAGKHVESGRDGSSIVVDGQGYLVEPGDSGLSNDQLLRVLAGVRPGPATDDPLAS